ncbi:hypothetical protein CASFOL_021716 [Castilleja foliolosa]|uniref:Ribosomal protein S6 n=1 Tax=Castilleja foliolosa TaxID=1961234 RepID=A0ABD3CY91_9LAMI
MDSIALKSPHFPTNSKISFWASANGRKYASSSLFPCVSPFYSQRSKLKGNSAIVAAAKKENKRKKDDNHSFFSRPDEATGPFPERVLLKLKNVEEDGKLMPEFADVEERELFDSLNLQLESDMNVDQMRHYEVVYLIHEDHKEEVEIVNTKTREFIKEKKGKIWRFSDWGLRRLAYKIQKAKNAHYILMNFELEAKWINEFKTMLDRDERVIRHLVMKRDKAETEDCPPPPEFNSMHADANDDEDVNYDDDDEEWDDEGDVEDDDEEGIVIYVDGDDDEDGGAGDREKSSNIGRKKQELKR